MNIVTILGVFVIAGGLQFQNSLGLQASRSDLGGKKIAI